MSNPGVGLVIRARRHFCMSQADLAEALGITATSVGRLEAQPNPRLETLVKYGRAMGLKLRVSFEAPDGTIID